MSDIDKKNMERLYVETDEGEVLAVWVDKRVLKAMGYDKAVQQGISGTLFLLGVGVCAFIVGVNLAQLAPKRGLKKPKVLRKEAQKKQKEAWEIYQIKPSKDEIMFTHCTVRWTFVGPYQILKNIGSK